MSHISYLLGTENVSSITKLGNGNILQQLKETETRLFNVL